MKENFALVVCPKCGADEGVLCSRANGKNPPFRGWAHAERVALYRLGMTPDDIRREAVRSALRAEIVDGEWWPDGYRLRS